MSIEYKRCSSRAHVPKRAYQASAGYGLLSAERKILKPWNKEIVKLDLNIAFLNGYYGR